MRHNPYKARKLTMVLGLTGQTGAGKSTVCRLLQNEQDICVVDADKIGSYSLSCAFGR